MAISYGVGYEKLIIHQPHNTLLELINFGILFTCLFDLVLVYLEEITYWSILGIKKVKLKLGPTRSDIGLGKETLEVSFCDYVNGVCFDAFRQK